jgi:hypothetical protein
VKEERFSMLRQAAALVAFAVGSMLVSPSGVLAQSIKDLRTADKPLVLKAQGSFFIGGQKSEQTRVQLGGLGPEGHIAVNQMYVRYMVPQRGGRIPVPNPNPTLKALSNLASDLNGAVLMGHSQSGSFPLSAALLNPPVTKGLVLVEPGSCPTNYTPEQIKMLATVPLLVVFGDHRDTPTGIAALPTWQERFVNCQALISQINTAGGRAQMVNPPERGIRGNSHMIMQDKNNLQIADLILGWIDKQVASRSRKN